MNADKQIIRLGLNSLEKEFSKKIAEEYCNKVEIVNIVNVAQDLNESKMELLIAKACDIFKKLKEVRVISENLLVFQSAQKFLNLQKLKPAYVNGIKMTLEDFNFLTKNLDQKTFENIKNLKINGR